MIVRIFYITVLSVFLGYNVIAETLDSTSGQGTSELALTINTEPLPINFSHPNLMADISQPGEKGVIAQSDSVMMVSGVITDESTHYQLAFGGYEAGQASLHGGEKSNGMALLSDSGHFGGVVRSLTWQGYGDDQTAIPITNKTMQSKAGCSLNYHQLGEGVSIIFGLNASCKIEMTGKQLQAFDQQAVTATIDIDRAATTSTYSVTVFVTLSEI